MVLLWRSCCTGWGCDCALLLWCLGRAWLIWPGKSTKKKADKKNASLYPQDDACALQMGLENLQQSVAVEVDMRDRPNKLSKKSMVSTLPISLVVAVD